MGGRVVKLAERFPKRALGNRFFMLVWLTFLISGVLFLIPSLRSGEWLTAAASATFMVGVILGLFYYERQREEERDHHHQE